MVNLTFDDKTSSLTNICTSIMQYRLLMSNGVEYLVFQSHKKNYPASCIQNQLIATDSESLCDKTLIGFSADRSFGQIYSPFLILKHTTKSCTFLLLNFFISFNGHTYGTLIPNIFILNQNITFKIIQIQQ